MIINSNKSTSQEEAWAIIKPVCRELYELANAGNIQFASGIYNDSNGTYKINLSWVQYVVTDCYFSLILCINSRV
jgi:hypothetical protein